MKHIYSSCVLLFISGVFQALSVKNKDFIKLNIGEVWVQLHKHQQNDVASLAFGLHIRTGGEICVHGSTGLSAIDFIRAVILQHAHWLHLLYAISFLALLHTDSFPSPLLAFLLLPSLGASSQWGKGEAANWDGILSTPSAVEISMSVNVHPQLLSIGLLFSLCSLCLPVAHMVCLSLILHLPEVPWGNAHFVPWHSKCESSWAVVKEINTLLLLAFSAQRALPSSL